MQSARIPVYGKRNKDLILMGTIEIPWILWLGKESRVRMSTMPAVSRGVSSLDDRAPDTMVELARIQVAIRMNGTRQKCVALQWIEGRIEDVGSLRRARGG